MAFYNHFFKEEFLSTVSEKNRYYYRSLFNRSANLEQQLNKDLYNFTDAEVEIFLYSINTSQKNTLVTYLNQAKNYCEYAIEKGGKISNINVFKSFSYGSLDKYTAKHKMKHLSKNDLEIALKDIVNSNDFALYVALFEGVGGFEYTELSELKIDDVREAYNNPVEDGYVIELRSEQKYSKEIKTRKLTVTKNLLKYLEQSHAQKTYLLKNGASEFTKNERDIIDGSYVFRNVTTTNRPDGKIDKQFIYRKIKVLSEATEGEISSISTLINSGVIYYMYLLADEDNKINVKDLKYVTDRFGLSVNSLSPHSSYKTLAKKHKEALEANYNVAFANL
ncbi:phage lytic cycle repressor MrpR family protein [Staphylococcus succinus]|uniref:phage lytic cycle repressor MrpR family protein n=1 Tax=Staphylococcus succinus TaxID=61015 RepID=UPI003F5C354D